MQTTYFYLAASGILTVVLWAPYIVNRLLEWGIADFIRNYRDDFPASMQVKSTWATRAQRAHLNLVETLPAFVAVIVAASFNSNVNVEYVNLWATIFFYARVCHALVYILGTAYIRTPIYLISWLSVIIIGCETIF
ncbi:hypothetical protein tinsulaeT_32730 [Thalassotalea insulae]|uniref:MAPEG family protein n=1 Tax=Thalassotalea insulae TaxID=2056778 RepID=A0ABQ6GVJ3_9GAMM|nr:MAPEG family protein [Thalassotalea insulae]GLX79933.1 hypothetical protein tinsulaeT_32730 [Thalassotalea insulae]